MNSSFCIPKQSGDELHSSVITDENMWVLNLMPGTCSMEGSLIAFLNVCARGKREDKYRQTETKEILMGME
jgi:hypothetical protein